MMFFNPENIDILVEPQSNIDNELMTELIDKLSNIKESLETMPDKFSDIRDKLNPIPELIEVLKPISKVLHIITHPIIIWNGLISISYWLAIGVATTSLIFYVATDSKKCIRITTGIMVAYTLLKAIDGVLK